LWHPESIRECVTFIWLVQAYFAFDVAEYVADYNNEQLDEAVILKHPF